MQPGGMSRAYGSQSGGDPYDYSWYTAAPAAAAAQQGMHMGYAQPGYVHVQAGYASADTRGAVDGAAAAAAAQAAAAYGGYPYQAHVADQSGRVWHAAYPGFESARPPTLPPAQPSSMMVAPAQETYSGGGDFLHRLMPTPVRGASGPAASAADAAAAAAAHRNSSVGAFAHQAEPKEPARGCYGQPPQVPPPPNRPADGASEQETKAKYGLLGIRNLVRMNDPDLSMLASGMVLTTLGLDLNSADNLYSTFASPWVETPQPPIEPDYYLPPCYYRHPPQLKQTHLQRFPLTTLFHIFFNMPRDTLQAYAAAELYGRHWKYHRELKMWFFLVEQNEESRWVCFDSNLWEQRDYNQPFDESGFLSEDDVRVRISKAPASAN